MSDPQLAELCKGIYTLKTISETTPIWVPVIGGALASILGGYIAVVLRIRLERKQEIEYIKTGLYDELTEISVIISKMLETYESTKIIPASYFNDLSENSDSFKKHQEKLFLIRNSQLRKEVTDFYKKLIKEVDKARQTVGTLKEKDNTFASNVTAIFTSIRTEASNLQISLKKYKY